MEHLQRGDGRAAAPPRRSPLRPLVVGSRHAARHGRRAADRARLVTPVVLIVDSYVDEAEMYTQYLQSRGADVEYMRTPEEALSRLTAARPMVIVTDMVFERSAFDGPRFLRALRERPECAMTNFIVLSGFTRPIDRHRARIAGADRFLVKPCGPDELWRHVTSAVWAHDRTSRAAWNWPDDGFIEPDPTQLPI